MSEPFLAEIKIVGFNFAPRGWAFCDGQILPINQNQSLYSLLGTTYGGDGRTSFGLPDLRGRSPLHPGNPFTLGLKAGEETHTLIPVEVPEHKHGLKVSSGDANTSNPVNNRYAKSSQLRFRKPQSTDSLTTVFTSNTGGGQAHDNMQPFIAVNFCIALQGLFPSRN